MEIAFHVKTYSELTKDELYDILSLRAEVFIVEQGYNFRDPDGVDCLALHIMGVDAQSNIICCLRIIPPGVDYPGSSSEHVRIGRVLCVEKDRGRGFGQQLMQRALEEIGKRWPGVSLELSAYVKTALFYKQFGFRESGPVFKRRDRENMRMIKEAK